MYKYLITLMVAVGVSVCLAGSTQAASRETPEPPPKVYEVQPGDSLSLIATTEGLATWRPLWDANVELTDPDYIEIGQKLKVPNGPVAERPLPQAAAEVQPRVMVPTQAMARPAGPHQAGASGDVLARIRQRESGGNYATNTNNGYYGAYQFSLGTWQSVGGSGLPSAASPAEQDMRAQMLYQRRGCSPWPSTCY